MYLRGMTLAKDLTLELDVGGKQVRLTFQDVRGFRVLDEGDLIEFWERYHTGNGWLWEVQSGGWLDLERRRSTFLTAHSNYREFLVVTGDFCVSVLTRVMPEWAIL